MSPTTMTRLGLAVPLFAATLAAACDPQADPGYQGEPLATLRGTVVSAVPSPPDDLDAVLVWTVSSGSPDYAVGQGAAIAGDFPATFRLDGFTRPPELALNDYGPVEPRLGVAYTAALPPGTDFSEEPTGSIGLSEDYLLVYLDAAAPAGSGVAEFLGGPLAAGYHLMKVIDVDDPACPGESFDCVRPAEGGLGTSIEIVVDDAENLDPPNWT